MAVGLGYKQSAEHVRKRMEARQCAARERPRAVSREWLVEKYIGARLDCVQIAALVSRDHKTVWTWLKHYGIPTRSRGVACTHLFVKGQVTPFTGRKHSEATKAKLRAIAIADGRRPFDPEVGPPFRGKRGAETPNWKGGVSPERQAFYASSEWKAALKIVWARANARCERCRVHHNGTPRRGTFHVHHIVSFAVRNLRAVPSNLALLCASCHRFVHSKRNVVRELLGVVT